MYPLIVIGPVQIYLFGIFMVLAWVLFFALLHTYALKKGLTKHVFGAIVPFTFCIFLFGRIFYILSEWRTEKFLFQDILQGNISFFSFLKQFFITENYNLSLAGGIFGFFVVFFFLTRRQKKNRLPSLDVICSAFLLPAIIGYIGALLGGQLYGVPFESFLSISYTNKYSTIPFQKELFPLPLLYIIALIFLFIGWKRMERLALPAGYVGFFLLGSFGGVLFLFEFLNGSKDMFTGYISISINQLLGLCFLGVSLLGILKRLRI